jgi:outer membrane receptor for ferrienterochelin and colicin
MKRKLSWAANIFACSTLTALPSLSTAAPALEEVIVTAEKREESLQDVPISIVAFTQDNLEKLGISDIKGLASQVPNVLINEFTGSSTTVRLFIRGVGQNDVQVTQDPSARSTWTESTSGRRLEQPLKRLIYSVSKFYVAPRAPCTAETPREALSILLPMSRPR